MENIILKSFGMLFTHYTRMSINRIFTVNARSNIVILILSLFSIELFVKVYIIECVLIF